MYFLPLSLTQRPNNFPKSTNTNYSCFNIYFSPVISACFISWSFSSSYLQLKLALVLTAVSKRRILILYPKHSIIKVILCPKYSTTFWRLLLISQVSKHIWNPITKVMCNVCLLFWKNITILFLNKFSWPKLYDFYLQGGSVGF